MLSTLSYTQVNKEDHCERHVNMRVMMIFVNMESPKVLAESSKMTYICYIRAEKVMIIHKGLLILLVKPTMRAQVA